MSGRALRSASLPAALLAGAALALPTPVAARPAGTAAVTLTNVHLSAVWNEGWLTASLKFTITVGAPTSVSATVRSVDPGPVASHASYTLANAGSTSETIKLPARLVPRAYTLTVTGAAAARFTIPTPAEGIVDTATISSARGGKETHALASPHELWVRFHFLTPPTAAKTVKIEWRTPSFTFVGAVTKPYATTIDSSLASGAALPRGTWYAILTVAGKTAKRIDVRVT